MLYSLIKQGLFYCAVSCLAACSALQKEPSVRDQFGHIVNIAYTPNDSTRGGGWFTDQGSWMGFTPAQSEQWVNGFCGPFSIDRRYWFAQTAVKVSFGNETEIFRCDSTNYLPGELHLWSSSPSGNLHQRMFFASASTALISIKPGNGQQKLYLSGQHWNKEVELSLQNNTVIARHPSGEIIALSFAPDTKVELTARGNYSAICTAQNTAHIAVSFFYNEQEVSVGIGKAEELLANTEMAQLANEARWNGYLTKVLRKDLPSDYNRIAVKSVVTLLSNWRTHRGGLLHEGIIPSHAVGYFVGFWAWDSWRFSVALAKFAPELAKNNIRAMFDYQQPDGMIIDCIYTNPEENNARDSKPPLAAWAVDEVFKQTQDTAFVREMYPELLAYHRWWYNKRDHNRNGICEFGSTDGTTEAAAWESGMDNAIRFDDTKMVKNADDAWSFDQESVDLNAYLALEYKLLKKFAKLIGQPFEERDYTAGVADYFFDQERGFFFDRRLKDGTFVREEGCEAYIPFWTGIAKPEQMERALKLFNDSTKFATYIPFPTVAADNPKFMPKGYWRGPIWLDQTYFAIKGLRNYGHNDLADRCTRLVFDRLKGLKSDSPIHENYGTHTGELLKAPHFSWSSVHLLLLYEELSANTDKL